MYSSMKKTEVVLCRSCCGPEDGKKIGTSEEQTIRLDFADSLLATFLFPVVNLVHRMNFPHLLWVALERVWTGSLNFLVFLSEATIQVPRGVLDLTEEEADEECFDHETKRVLEVYCSLAKSKKSQKSLDVDGC